MTINNWGGELTERFNSIFVRPVKLSLLAGGKYLDGSAAGYWFHESIQRPVLRSERYAISPKSLSALK